MSRPKTIDWEKAKSDYISNRGKSLKKVAEKYKISYTYIREVAQKEGWKKEKDKRWEEAGEKALDKIQDSMSEMIIRHAKVGRFLQTIGVKRLERKYKMLLAMEQSGKRVKGLKEFEDRTLAYMVKVGAGIERAAFPEKIDLTADVRFSGKGLSKAVDKAMYDVFRKNITRRKPARKRGRG